MKVSSSVDSGKGSEAYNFDQVLKKLETVKQVKKQMKDEEEDARSTGGRKRFNSDSTSDHLHHHDSSYPTEEEEHTAQDDKPKQDSRHESSSFTEGRSHGNDIHNFSSNRQSFIDRREGYDIDFQDSVASFIESNSRNAPPFFEEQGLPDAILKLDRKHAIPRPRHENDVLVEIEVRKLC